MRKESKEKLLKKILLIIKKNPGIRPSQLNKLINIPHTANLRNSLIKRGLIKKERKRNAVYYFLIQK